MLALAEGAMVSIPNIGLRAQGDRQFANTAVAQENIRITTGSASAPRLSVPNGFPVHRPRRNVASAARLPRDRLNWLAFASVLLMVAGLVMGILRPGNAAGVLLPIGLAIWWLIGAYARNRDRRSAS